MNNHITPGRPIRAYGENGQWADHGTDDLVGHGLNRFKGWRCGAGVENLSINMDGDIHAATCKVRGRLGNVYESFEIPNEWVKCGHERCSCGADLFIPKLASEKHQDLLRCSQGKEVELEKRVSSVPQILATERTHASNRKQIYWEIGRRCNYDCSYCSPHIHDKVERHKSSEELMAATQRIFDRFSKGALVNFIISGGEPTLNPALMDWLKFISSHGHHISLHSNGSRLPEYYRELVHYADLNLSAHFEFMRSEKFLKNVEAITEEKVKHRNQNVGHLEVKLMMIPGIRAQALEFEEKLRQIPGFKDYCTWAIVPVRVIGQEYLRANYEPQDFELFGDRR